MDPPDRGSGTSGSKSVFVGEPTGDGSANQIRTADETQVWERIGFEIETDFRILGGSVSLAYGEVVLQATGWCIKVDGLSETADEGVLEFVIEHKLEWDEIQPIIRQVTGFVESIIKQLMKRECSLKELVDQFERTTDLKVVSKASYRISCIPKGKEKPSPRACLGAPQMTFGVPLARVPHVLQAAQALRLEEHDRRAAQNEANQWRISQKKRKKEVSKNDLGTMREKRYAELSPSYLVRSHIALNRSGMDPAETVFAWVKVQKERTDIPHIHSNEIDKIAGLLTLVLRYLDDGYYPVHPVVYAKSYFMVMARTHFAAMFQSIGGEAQGLCEEALGELVLTWSEETDIDKLDKRHVCRSGFRDSGLDSLALRQRRRSTRDGDHVPFNGVVRSGGTVLYHGPSIGAWLRSIQNPRDEVSKEETIIARVIKDLYREDPSIHKYVKSILKKDLMSQGSLAYNSISMGLFNVKQIEGIPFVVLEIRDWPNWSIPPRLWEPLLKRLWEFFRDECGAEVQKTST